MVESSVASCEGWLSCDDGGIAFPGIETEVPSYELIVMDIENDVALWDVGVGVLVMSHNWPPS